jgi:hypothetical protein
MLLPAPPLRPPKGKTKANPTPKRPVVNQIVDVNWAGDVDKIVVTLSQPLVAWDDVAAMLVVNDGVNDFFPVSVDDENRTSPVFAFDTDVSFTKLWRVPGPENWHFENGEPMVAPFDGGIE